MEALTQKSWTTAAGVTYNYYCAGAATARPTVLLLHGCPDGAELWTELIVKYLRPAGYGVVAPDLIGYGGSSQPADGNAYAMHRIAQDVIGILDHENLPKVVVLGHDFGALLASRVACFHPDRTAGLITLGSTYFPPSPSPFDLDQWTATQIQQQGYSSTAYFKFFVTPGSAARMDDNLPRVFTLLHGGGARMKDILCVDGGIEHWLDGVNIAEGSPPDTADVLPYAAAPGFREAWLGRMSRNGWTAPLRWYKGVVDNLSLEAEQKALAAGTHTLKVPYLFVAAQHDPLARPEAIDVIKHYQLAPDCTTAQVDASHWLMLEQPDDVGRAVTDWLGTKFTADAS